MHMCIDYLGPSMGGLGALEILGYSFECSEFLGFKFLKASL